MANARKHMERSHRSHKNRRPFMYFEASAMNRNLYKGRRQSVLELIKATVGSLFHRTKNK